jgi:3'-phosphoadenosine 5'-phosphosulfate sulfotransferase (PAPS reductase)/FAD synthetase
VLRWRPVLRWSEEQVWEIIARWRVRPHVGYELGWGRLSCAACIFGDPDQWAALKVVLPELFAEVARAEAESGYNIHRTLSVPELASRGRSFLPTGAELRNLVKIARREGDYGVPVILGPGETWTYPRGAFRRGGGPS